MSAHGPASNGWVIYADDSLVVANKPAGLLSVPGRTESDCLAARVQSEYPDALVVHRLDQATSGLMVFARGKANERHVSKQFQARTVRKRYEALVVGHVRDVQGVIALPLAADWPSRPLQKVDLENGKPSRTRWRVMAYDASADCTRLALEPETGRTHQLRVHLQAVGHSIVGDRLYAGPEAPRLMLHAYALGIAHPETGEAMHWESAAPF